MGRKIKKYLVIAIVVVMTSAYLRAGKYAGQMFPVYAENNTGDKAESQEKEEKEDEETEKENDREEDFENTEEKDENDVQEKEEEETEFEENYEEIEMVSNEIIKQVEEVELYQISYEEPDGKNGYYVKRPQVSLRHISPNGITKYRAMNGMGDKQEGTLNHIGTENVISERFTEGKNILEVWMEDADGQVIEGSESRMEFMLDLLNPKVKVNAPKGFRTWYQDEAVLSVETDDGVRGSQVAEIECKVGDRVIGKVEGNTAQFRITEPADNGQGILFHVTVTDHAGNHTESIERLSIDKKAPETSITGIQDYQITSRPVQITYMAKEENLMKEINAGIHHEDEKGNTTQKNISGWEENRQEKISHQTLNENGIYKVHISAVDMAGHESKTEKQVIIDKDNPVIMHVEELDGKYMKAFQWGYETRDWIQDFTSYTYLMQLDDEVYKPGEKIEKEGTHILRVSAEDAAGNTGEASAKFVIDRTPPVIHFQNVSEGEIYEKERTIKIQTDKKEDFIEKVKINGKEQKLKKKNADSYECKVNEEKAYEIEVLAKDFAQNETVSRVSFQIGAEKTMLQKIIDPLKKTFGGGKDSKNSSEQGDSGSKKGTKGGYLLWKIAGGLAAGSLIGIVGYRKREYLKAFIKRIRSDK